MQNIRVLWLASATATAVLFLPASAEEAKREFSFLEPSSITCGDGTSYLQFAVIDAKSDKTKRGERVFSGTLAATTGHDPEKDAKYIAAHNAVGLMESRNGLYRTTKSQSLNGVFRTIVIDTNVNHKKFPRRVDPIIKPQSPLKENLEAYTALANEMVEDAQKLGAELCRNRQDQNPTVELSSKHPGARALFAKFDRLYDLAGAPRPR